MVNGRSRKCRIEGYGKQPYFGVTGTITGEYCAQHALEKMVYVNSKKCRTEGCGKRPSFGVAGTKTGEFCAQHALEGMVEVKRKKCRAASCGKVPSFGVAGTITGKYCAQHAPEGMVNVKKRKCRIEGCGKLPFSELRVRKRWNTVQGIPWTGWCKSKTESAEPKGATKSRCWELPTQERQSTVHSTPDHNAVSKDSGRERLAHTTPGRKPLLT